MGDARGGRSSEPTREQAGNVSVGSCALSAAIVVTSAVLVGTAGAQGPERAPSAAKPTRGGSVTYGLEAETNGGWCIPQAQLVISGIMVASAIYDTLTVPNSTGKIVPYLAKSVEHDPTYTKWTITLRDGVQFHDGTPLTADAVKQNIDAWRKGRLLGFVFTNIADTAVVDPLTVQVTTKVPWVDFDCLPVPRRTRRHRRARPARQSRHVPDEPDRDRAVHDLQRRRPLDPEPGVRRHPQPALLAEGQERHAAALPRQDHVQAQPRRRAAPEPAPGRPARHHAHDQRPGDRPSSTASSSLNQMREKAGNARCATTSSTWPSRRSTTSTPARRSRTRLDTQPDQRDPQRRPAPGRRPAVRHQGAGPLEESRVPEARPREGEEDGEGLQGRARRAVRRGDREHQRSREQRRGPAHQASSSRKAGINATLQQEDQTSFINTALGGNFSLLLWRNHPGEDPDTQYVWWTAASPDQLRQVQGPAAAGAARPGPRRSPIPRSARAIYEQVNKIFATQVYNVWAYYGNSGTSRRTRRCRASWARRSPTVAAQPEFLFGQHPVLGLWIKK